MFPESVRLSKLNVPAAETTSIPPPALLAELFETVIPSTTMLPPLVRIPPPEPAVPVALLSSITEVPSTIRFPPSL